jgi:S-adenosylmethionine:tRNA ribosyltransferase-isomerase
VRRELFTYALPPELIAARPPAERDGARLLVVGRDALQHRTVRELPALLPEGALLVLNDTKVVPARLFGKKRGSGGRVELLLVRCLDASHGGQRWEALGRASKPLRAGTVIDVEPDGVLSATVERANEGTLDVALTPLAGHTVESALATVGHMPLPPYMHRPDDAEDRERYQTVFARVPGAVAAPTAGLHLSEALLAALRRAASSDGDGDAARRARDLPAP